MSNVKIEKFFPPLYKGHNNEMNYRYLGLFPAIVMGYEIIKAQTVLYVRYRYPGEGLSRRVPFRPLHPGTITFFISTIPIYIVFDAIYRNKKYMSEGSFLEKLGYTTDLTLFHLIATLYLPHKIINFSAIKISNLLSKITRRSIPLLWLSTSLLIIIGSLQFKAIDIFTDVLLDNSFRYIYDFKEKTSIKSSNYE